MEARLEKMWGEVESKRRLGIAREGKRGGEVDDGEVATHAYIERE